MISAPKAPSQRVAHGPARTQLKSTTRVPARLFIRTPSLSTELGSYSSHTQARKPGTDDPPSGDGIHPSPSPTGDRFADAAFGCGLSCRIWSITLAAAAGSEKIDVANTVKLSTAANAAQISDRSMRLREAISPPNVNDGLALISAL